MSGFSASAAITNPAAQALQAALSILANNGFAIQARDENSATLTGPGLNSTRQNPLLGATKICLVQDENQLRLNAELGGADRLQRFLKSIPWFTGLGTVMLHVFLGGVFGSKFGTSFGVPGASGWTWVAITLGAGVIVAFPWFFFSAWMSSMIRASTEDALKKLVNNAVELSRGR